MITIPPEEISCTLHFYACKPSTWKGRVLVCFGHPCLGEWNSALLEMKFHRFV